MKRNFYYLGKPLPRWFFVVGCFGWKDDMGVGVPIRDFGVLNALGVNILILPKNRHWFPFYKRWKFVYYLPRTSRKHRAAKTTKNYREQVKTPECHRNFNQ